MFGSGQIMAVYLVKLEAQYLIMELKTIEKHK